MISFIVRLFRALINFFLRLFGISVTPAPGINQPPSVTILSPSADVVGDKVFIEYRLQDNESDITDIVVTYSVAGSQPQAATADASDVRHSGATRLSTSRTGITYQFVWKWQRDITQDPVDNVVISLQPKNSFGQGARVSASPLRLSSAPAVPANIPPTVRIDPPTGVLLQGEYVMISYHLSDPNADPAHIEAYYSTDGGTSFHVATEATHPSTEGTSNLTTSLIGIPHVFIWHAKRDLPALPANVMFKINSYDTQTGRSDTTPAFTIGSAASNHPPHVTILSPVQNSQQAGAVAIVYEIKDDNADPARIEVMYSLDNGLTFLTATEASGFGSEGISNLATSPGGTRHIFFWKAAQDITLPASNVVIQLQAFDSDPGGVASIAQLEIIDNYPPSAQIFAPALNSLQPAPVKVEYVLTDREGEMCELEAFYSVDGGATFLPATSHNSGDGTSQLISSPVGEGRSFVWDAARDLNTTNQVDVFFKIRVRDQFPGGISISPKFSVGLPVAPVVRMVQPTPGTWGSPVPLVYNLIHPNNNQQLNVEIEYSLDGGITYHIASEAPNAGSEGLTGLISDPQGVRHFFAWDIERDILGINVQQDILVRIKAFHGSETGTGFSEPFTVDVNYAGIADNHLTSGSLPAAPGIFVFDPPSHEGMHVAARFLVKHPDNLKVNVTVEFAVNNQPYRPATIAFYSDRLTNLAAPHSSADYQFVWDAKADLEKLMLNTGSIRLRFTPYTGAVTGAAVETAPFNFTIKTPVPVQKVPPKTQFDSLSCTIIEGDRQGVIPGLLANKPLVVEVRDATGELLRDARVTFSLGANSQVPVSFEQHPTLGTTTDYYGKAGILVKPKEGLEGDIQILVHIVGMSGVVAVFNLNAKLPKIVPSINNPLPPFKYGEVYTFTFQLDSEADPTTIDFFPDAYRPVEFRVTTVNAEASTKLIRLPGTLAIGNTFSVKVTPSHLGGTSASPGTQTFDLKIEALNLPRVLPYEKRFSVQTDFNAEHLAGVTVANNGFGPRNLMYDQKRLHLKVISGHDPADPSLRQPQTSFPGLTLSTPFEVKVVNDNDEEYTESTAMSGTVETFGSCDQIVVTKEPLKISWRAVGGVIATTPVKGNVNHLELAHNERVYFTPTENGPWSLEARVINYVYDKDFAKRPYRIKRNTGSGSSSTIVADPYCAAHPGLTTLSRTFFIQDPEVMGFEDITQATSSAPGPLLKKVKPGMKSRILVHRISPVASSQSDEVEIRNVKSDGATIQYTGTALKFDQKIRLRKDGVDPGILRSDEILFVQNEERTSSGIPVAMLPLSRIRVEIKHLKFSIETAGLKRQRLRFGAAALEGDTEFQYESPAGTSRFDGAQETVCLHNGEFILDDCDISFNSRVGTTDILRTYRSQLQSLMDPDDRTDVADLFGPGWFLEAAMYLEVAHKHIRFWDGSGAYFDYLFDFSGPGQFLFITRNTVITTDQSAYEIRDRHRNYLHFNIDGTLRYQIDRFGNKREFKYNEKAQLIEIRDCILPNIRKYTINYYDHTPDNVRNRWVDKIREITDFEGRKVGYVYYAKGELRNGREVGGAGFLKQVIKPECETVLEGNTSSLSNPPKRHTYELYEYEKDTRLGWRLKSVFIEDSRGNEKVLFTNHYDANGKVVRQEEGAGEYVITYSGNSVEVKDKNDYVGKFLFPNSPYWNAAAPKEIADAENNVTELRHNIDGLLVYAKPPKGGTADYVYDENSPFARARADLLAVIVTSEDGKERVTTTTYDGRFRMPITSVGPDGNRPGVDPELYTYVSNYDYQRNTGDAGNVADSFGPRSLTMVYKVLAGDQRQPVWIDEEKQHHYTYNGFGQITSHVDERGVKTEYFYYADGNPTGGSIGPIGGGFLAMIKYDTESTAKRDLYIPGSDAAPQPTHVSYRYNNLGQLIETTDDKGIKTTYTRNNLGEIIKEEIGIGVKGLNITTLKGYGPTGEVTITKILQAGTGLQEIDEVNEYDQHGRLVKQISKINGTHQTTFTYTYDKGDRLETTTDSQTGTVTAQEYDGRNLETVTTVQSGTVTLKTIKAYTENGSLKEITLPNGEKTVYIQNTFGENVKETNESTGISKEYLLNEAGVPVVTLLKDNAGKTGSAQESVLDACLTVRRIHELNYKANGIPSGKFRKPSEYVGISESYLAGLGELLPDFGFAPNDGRTTTDLSWDIGGGLVQVKNDGLGQHLSRYDGLRRLLEFDDRNGLKLNRVFDDANNAMETSYTASLEDPQFSEAPHTYKSHFQFTGARVPISIRDERNRVTSFETDDSGKIDKITNPENTVSEIKYDALNNIESIETGLFVSGNHPDAAELQQGISLYNPGLKILATNSFDPLGRLETSKDSAGNEFQYVYENNLLKRIIHPGNLGEEIFSYDPEGRLETHIRPGGVTTTFAYDNGRLSGVNVGQEDIQYGFDEWGRVKEMKDVNDPSKRTEFEYDSRGNIIKITQNVNGQPNSTTYEYDGVGRLTKIVYPNTDFLEYAYDNKTGKLKEIRDQHRILSTFSYYGEMIKEEINNGTRTLYEYDHGQLIRKRITGSASGDIETTFVFDIMDRLIEEVQTIGGLQRTKKYVYDSTGRLLKEESQLPGLPPLIIRYYYDGDGVVMKEVRDEYDPLTGNIERLEIERTRNERGEISRYEVISRTIVHNGSGVSP